MIDINQQRQYNSFNFISFTIFQEVIIKRAFTKICSAISYETFFRRNEKIFWVGFSRKFLNSYLLEKTRSGNQSEGKFCCKTEISSLRGNTNVNVRIMEIEM